MTRFLKVEGESLWINLTRIDGLMVRPQLRAIGHSGPDHLDERHESTGAFEVVVFTQDKTLPVRVFDNRAEAEAWVREMLGELEA